MMMVIVIIFIIIITMYTSSMLTLGHHIKSLQLMCKHNHHQTHHENQDVYLIPGIIEQLLLLLHERGLLREEAHADSLDVLQVLHVDVLHLWQQKPFVLFFFLLFLILTLVSVDFDEVVRAACGRVDDNSRPLLLLFQSRSGSSQGGSVCETNISFAITRQS